MNEQELINDDNEDSFAMEVEVSSTDENEIDQVVASVSQSSTIPVGESRNIGGNEIISRSGMMEIINLAGFEVVDEYETEAAYSSTDESRTNSPRIFQDDFNSNDNQAPSENANSTLKSESPSKKRRLSVEDNNDDDGKLCPICLDNWTNTGDHRICSLRCGHLFGLSCIKRWLHSESKKCCPTCKKKVNIRHDIRYIYAKKLIAMDTTEVDIVKKQMEMVTEEKNRIQIELTKTICREHLLVQQLDECKSKIKILTSKLETRERYPQSTSQCSINQNSNDIIRLYMDKSLELARDGGCRVLDYKNNSDVAVVSMKSPNSFFTGYGVRKISIMNYKPTAFIGLHKSQIRDMKFHSQNPWLASVSLDKVIKILDINSHNAVASVTSSCPLWSCCWDGDNPHMLFVGEQQGSVIKYDIRQMDEPVDTLFVPGDMSPVVSLAALKQEAGSPIAHGGVASCKLNSIWVFENAPNEYIRRHVPIEGPFVSMCYENSTKQLLVSCRPNPRTPFARHVVCNVNQEGDDLRCETIHCFPGGATQKMLSRSCFVTNRNNFVAAYHENQKCVCLWSISTGRKASSVPAHEPVLDMCGIQTNNANILLNLTEKKLEFFKFVE